MVTVNQVVTGLVIVGGLVHGSAFLGVNALSFVGSFAPIVQGVVGVAAVYLGYKTFIAK